jgi:hypothetical protein
VLQARTRPVGDLRAQIDADRIVVTLPGTSFRAVFLPSPDEPRLIQSPAVAINQHAEITSKDFEALAWEAANAKARELGWMA